VLGLLESVAYAVRANLEQLEEASGKRLEEVTLGGGMIQSPLLLRILSQVTERRLRVSAVAETAALGCALLAGIGAGIYADLDQAIAKAVRHDVIPPADPGPYGERYRTWRELFTTLNATTVP
jgi:sugar (pentulose or hexulose) kinase